MTRKEPIISSRVTALFIEKLDLQSSASKAMVAIEIILTAFFFIVIVLFLLYDLVTIFFPPRSQRASEALLIGSAVFLLSLLAIYGRERLEKMRPKTTKNDQQIRREGGQLPAWIFGAILLVFLMAIVVWPPPPQGQMVIRLLGSVFGGLISGFFLGTLKITGRAPLLSKIQISAIGGFAVFCLVFFSWR